MTRLDKIADDLTLAQQTIPNGDVTAEPGASILAARIRLQNEHAPDMLATLQAVVELADRWERNARRACDEADHGGTCADCVGSDYADLLRAELARLIEGK